MNFSEKLLTEFVREQTPLNIFFYNDSPSSFWGGTLIAKGEEWLLFNLYSSSGEPQGLRLIRRDRIFKLIWGENVRRQGDGESKIPSWSGESLTLEHFLAAQIEPRVWSDLYTEKDEIITGVPLSCDSETLVMELFDDDLLVLNGRVAVPLGEIHSVRVGSLTLLRCAQIIGLQ